METINDTSKLVAQAIDALNQENVDREEVVKLLEEALVKLTQAM
jgi:hypothetical protein